MTHLGAVQQHGDRQAVHGRIPPPLQKEASRAAHACTGQSANARAAWMAGKHMSDPRQTLFVYEMRSCTATGALQNSVVPDPLQAAVGNRLLLYPPNLVKSPQSPFRLIPFPSLLSLPQKREVKLTGNSAPLPQHH